MFLYELLIKLLISVILLDTLDALTPFSVETVLIEHYICFCASNW